jgi:hypothetical protein
MKYTSNTCAHRDAYCGCDRYHTNCADTVKMLLSKCNVSSLEAAQGITASIAIVRAKAQRARGEPLADRAGSLSATGTDAANRVQTLQHPLNTAEAQRPRSEVLEVAADQLWSRLITARKNVDNMKAELAAVLKGAQQSALSGHLQHYSNLLLQVIYLYSGFAGSIRSK